MAKQQSKNVCHCVPPIKKGALQDTEVQKLLRRAYYRVEYICPVNDQGFLKECLTEDVYQAFRGRRTSYGGSFWDVIQAGATLGEVEYGIYATDPEAYDVFSPLFNVILLHMHDFDINQRHPPHMWGNFRRFENLDPEGRYIKSTRIRLCRNVDGYPFAPIMTKTLFKEIEDNTVKVLQDLPGEFKGEYTPLESLSEDEQVDLRSEHLLFRWPNDSMDAANVGRFWPTGRGIYVNSAGNALVWIGKDDHIRIVSMSEGAEIQDVYVRLMKLTMWMEDRFDFAHDERLGYLTVDPVNLGSSLRASYLIKLPALQAAGLVESLCEEYGLQCWGTFGQGLPVLAGLYQISNFVRLGYCEWELVMQLQEGVKKLLEEEAKRQEGMGEYPEFMGEVGDFDTPVFTDKGPYRGGPAAEPPAKKAAGDGKGEREMYREEPYFVPPSRPPAGGASGKKKKKEKEEEPEEEEEEEEEAAEETEEGEEGATTEDEEAKGGEEEEEEEEEE